MIKLTQRINRQPLYIDPAQVAAIAAGTGGYTNIWLVGGETSFEVVEPVDVVMAMLNPAPEPKLTDKQRWTIAAALKHLGHACATREPLSAIVKHLLTDGGEYEAMTVVEIFDLSDTILNEQLP